MKISIHSTLQELGFESSGLAVKFLRQAIEDRGEANLILATGSSQFATLSTLVLTKEIEWEKVNFFHLDEYVGLPENHMASFRKYLKEKFTDKVGKLKSACFIEGDVLDVGAELLRLNQIMASNVPDLTLLGIGENGHLAFNDPPADMRTKDAYLMVKLDEACRIQQVNEGWFHNFARVPTHAITMSISKVLQSKVIIASVPGERKAVAVKNAVEGEVSADVPASVLQNHPNCTLFLDIDSASLLTREEVL